MSAAYIYSSAQRYPHDPPPRLALQYTFMKPEQPLQRGGVRPVICGNRSAALGTKSMCAPSGTPHVLANARWFTTCIRRIRAQNGGRQQMASGLWLTSKCMLH